MVRTPLRVPWSRLMSPDGGTTKDFIGYSLGAAGRLIRWAVFCSKESSMFSLSQMSPSRWFLTTLWPQKAGTVSLELAVTWMRSGQRRFGKFLLLGMSGLFWLLSFDFAFQNGLGPCPSCSAFTETRKTAPQRLTPTARKPS